jgi:hypothetical protein
MGAFSIAFDTIIVGSLALTWVLLVIHLFFSDKELSIGKLLDWVGKQNQPAVAGVLLFALAYSLGSAVSRIAQDFFDDDDLHFRVSHYLFRVGVTESSIRTDVSCHTLPHATATPKPGDPIAEKRETFKENNPDCVYTGRWVIRETIDPATNQQITAKWISEQEDGAEEIFRFQEATVLLQGTDSTERLRQFHDQIMVLRGAAFDGMLAFSLCLFWWSAKFQSWLRWAVLLPYLFPGAVTTWNHFKGHPNGPPYMEFTLLTLAAAGWYLLWKRRPKKQNLDGEPPTPKGAGEIRFAYLLLSLFLTVSAVLGWWATQVLYDEQVIYSYQALREAPARPVMTIPRY